MRSPVEFLLDKMLDIYVNMIENGQWSHDIHLLAKITVHEGDSN